MGVLRSRALRPLFNFSSARSLYTVCTTGIATEPAIPLASWRLSSSFRHGNSFRSVVSHGLQAPPLDLNHILIRCKVSNSNSGSNYSPLINSSPNWSDRPPVETAPLFPGCDYEHWLIVMDAPGGGKATKQEMVDCYVKTLASVLGSEEAAIKSIYNVSTERYYGFGCQISEETSYKLKGLPGVCFVLPDSYVDATHKDYGGELFVDGKIVQRTPERQRLIDPAPQRNNDRPRYNDRSRYVRRRGNQG